MWFYYGKTFGRLCARSAAFSRTGSFVLKKGGKEMFPEKFLLWMKEMLGPEFDAYWDSMQRPPKKGVRLNGEK